MTILNHGTTASSTFKYQVGANGGQTIAVDFGDMRNNGSGVFAALATVTRKSRCCDHRFSYYWRHKRCRLD